MSVRVFSVHKLAGYSPGNLTGHRSTVRAVFFASHAAGRERMLYAVSRDGALSVWKLTERPDVVDAAVEAERAALVAAGGEGRGEDALGRWWELCARHYFEKNHARVTSAAMHAAAQVLVVGFNSGAFSLYELPDCNEIHTLSISEHRVDACAVSPGGEWLAFGCGQLGQLLVWEWQSETYVLKQQGHFFAEVNCLAYSPGGTVIATGGGDSKVKLWSPSSGFCFVTFSEHTAPVTDIAFVPHGRALVSASLDGTVRAYDMLRYRNFQTLVSPTPAQFGCVTVDPSGEIVCAGSRDTLSVYVWNLQTAQLVETLSGHEAPIAALSFGGGGGGNSFLASASWDKSVRVWDFLSSKAAIDVLQHSSDVLAVAFQPGGALLATATLDGRICLWDAKEAEQTGTIDGRADIAAGRSVLSKVTAKNSSGGKCFRSLAFSADGQSIIAGGSSKFVCLYDVTQKVLLRKYAISNNVSLDGVRMQLNSSHLTDAGPVEDLLLDEDSDGQGVPLPRAAVRRSERVTRLAVRAMCVRFSPDGRAWAAASTEGLLIFSLDDALLFDPSGLELETTPAAVAEAVRRREFSRALPMALCLNEAKLIRAVWQQVPPDGVALVAHSLPVPYVERFLQFLGSEMEGSRHLQLLLMWVQQILLHHGRHVKDHPRTYEVSLQTLHKSVRLRYDDLASMCHNNQFDLAFLVDQSRHTAARA